MTEKLIQAQQQVLRIVRMWGSWPWALYHRPKWMHGEDWQTCLDRGLVEPDKRAGCYCLTAAGRSMLSPSWTQSASERR